MNDMTGGFPIDGQIPQGLAANFRLLQTSTSS